MSAPAMTGGPRASWQRVVIDGLEAGGYVTRRRGDSHIEFRCPVPAHDDRRASGTADYKADRECTDICCHGGCDNRDVLGAIGLELRDLFDVPGPRGAVRTLPHPRRSAQRGRQAPSTAAGPACRHRYAPDPDYPEHVYVNAAGELLARVIRKRCSSCGGKDIRPDRSGWATADRVLYRLPEVLAAVRDGRTVYVVEGEKSADAIAALGEVATTCPFGAGKWLPQHTAVLAEARHVVVVADNDHDGYSHAALVAGELAAAPGTELVEVVRGLVDAPKADVVDHLAAGHALADLLPVDPYERLAILGRAAELAEPTANVAQLDGRRSGRGRGGPPSSGDQDDGGQLDPPPGARLIDGSPGWVYVPPNGDYPGAVLNLSGSGAHRGWSQVVSWAPAVESALVTEADDGRATGRHFELTVGADTAIVSNADLRSGDAWDKFPDASGLGAKRVREVMHNLVTGAGRAKPRTLAADRTGWHGQDGSRFYLHADGRTFPDSRRVRLIGAPPRLARAAAPLDAAASPDQMRRALEQIRDHGRAPALFSLAAGARSLAQSLVPVRAAYALVGPQNAGKSCAAGHGRGLVLTRQPDPFPYVPTKGFGSTRTDLEFAVNFEADMPQVIEDLALAGDAPAAEVRDAVAKLEALIRPVANDDEIRGRRTRDLLPAPANYVRSIPTATAQALPAGMQSSLYRRAVVFYLREGDVDTAWYAPASLGGSDGGRLLAVPLRGIGDLLIARLYEHGDDVEPVLAGYGAEAFRLLSPEMDAVLPGWHGLGDGTTGIVRSAAGMLAGLGMIADVLEGAALAELAAPVLGPLAASLAEQASKMADRQAAADSLGDAVARVLTSALMNRRAYVCGKNGTPAPLVPGLAPSEQGLRSVGSQFGASEYEGQGMPLYWLPDHSAVGVRSEALHALLTEAREPRIAAMTAKSLPEALVREGAAIANPATGRAGTHRVRAGAGSEPLRLVLLRPELLTGDEVFPRVVDISSGTSGTSGTSQVSEPPSDLSSGTAGVIGNIAGQSTSEPAGPAEPQEAVNAATSANVAPLAVPDSSGTGPRYVTSADRFAAPAVVADVDGGYLARPDRLEAIELPAPLANLAHAIGWALTLRIGMAHASGMPDDPVLVILPALAAGLGLPASPPDRGSKAAGQHAALAPLRDAGWQVRELASWMSVYRKGGRTVRVWLPGWDGRGECPLWGDDGVPAVTLAYRLGLFAEHLGIGWRLTGGITGADLARTFPRRKMQLAAAAEMPRPALIPAVEPEFTWSRSPMSDEAERGWLHCYDGNGAYTSAYGQAVVNLGGWRQAEAPAFDPKMPGYWLIDPPDWDRWQLPNPFDPTGRDAQTGHHGPRWYFTPTLAHAAELGYRIEPREAWLPDTDRNWGRWYEPWYERVRDARAALLADADPDSAPVLAALKHVWQQTHGVIGVKSQGSRKDHDHAIIAGYRQTLLRRLVKVGEAEQRWPLAIATDNVAFASADPDPRSACPAGIVLGDGLGQFKVKGTLPMADARPLLEAGGAGKVGTLFELASGYLAEHRKDRQ